MGTVATGTVRINQMEKAPLQDMIKMNKEKHVSSDKVTYVSLNITAICWKYNKLMNEIFTFTGKQPLQQAKHYCQNGE